MDRVIAVPKNWAIIQRIAKRLLVGDVVSGVELSRLIPTHLEYMELKDSTKLDGLPQSQ